MNESNFFPPRRQNKNQSNEIFKNADMYKIITILLILFKMFIVKIGLIFQKRLIVLMGD